MKTPQSFPRCLLVLALCPVSVLPAAPSELFAAMSMTKEQQASSVPTDSGVFIYHLEENKWGRIGPVIQHISSVTADPRNPEILYMACGNGIVRSVDGGLTWRLVTGWRESDVLRIVVDPIETTSLYAATAWGVIASFDRGDTWEARNTGLPEYYAKDIVLDAENPRRIVLATTTGLFESRNQARHWKRIRTFPQVAALRLENSQVDRQLWIAGTEGQGVWISRDDARNWHPTAPELADANVYGVAVDPHDGSRMAAGGWGTGVLVSADQGHSWQRAAGPEASPNITVMVYDDNVPGRLWVSTFEEGTFFSDDHGRTWTNANLDGAYVYDLDFLPPGTEQRASR